MPFQPTDSAERAAIRAGQPVGMGGPERHGAPGLAGRHDQTISFEAPANARPSRLLRARVKVNSTRQGTPRPTGPWSPKAFQHAAERKPNESGEVTPGAPVWPRSAEETMEYEAFARLSKNTAPVEDEPPTRGKSARIMARRSPTGAARAFNIADATRPVASDNMTVPLTGPPDALLASLRPGASTGGPAPARAREGASVIVLDRQRAEKVVAALLFCAMLGLLWLNLS